MRWQESSCRGLLERVPAITQEQNAPLLDGPCTVAFGHVEPLLLLLENLGDGATLDTVSVCNLLLARVRVVACVTADGLAVEVIQTRLARATRAAGRRDTVPSESDIECLMREERIAHGGVVDVADGHGGA